MPDKVTIHRIPETNLLVIKQTGKSFFLSAENAIIISIDMLASLLTFMVKNGIISIKVIEGILSECKE